MMGGGKPMRSIFWVFFIGLSVAGLMSQSLGQEKGQKKYGHHYYIGQDVLEIKNELSEISSAEYAPLNAFFKNGKIYHGKDIEYLNTKWATILGVRENKISKLRLQTNDKREVIWHEAFHDLIKEYGFSPDQGKTGQSSLTSWDTEWGNVSLSRKMVKGETVVDITFAEDHPFRELSKETIGGSSDRMVSKTEGQPQPSMGSLMAASKNAPSPDIRMDVVKNPGEIKDKHTVESLCEALADKSPNVRFQAVYALGALGEIDDRAIQCLMTALKDKDVSDAAGDSLIRMGGPAVKALTEALKDEE